MPESPLQVNSAQILDSITDAFFAVDREWRITYMNRQAEPLLEKTREQMLGQSLWELFPEAVGSIFYLRYHEAVASGRTVTFEEFYPPLNRWFNVNAYPSEGGLAVFFTDITERRQRELRLRESESRFRRLFDAGVIGSLIADLSGHIREANDAFLQMVGYTRAELEAGLVRWDAMTPPEFAARDAQAIAELLAHGSCEPYEKEYIHKDGRRIPILLGVAMLEGSGDLCIAYILDMTQRKRIEQERDTLLEQERAARIAAQAAQRRLAFLSDASTILASSLDYTETLRNIARLAVPDFADWTVVDLLNSDGTLHRAEVAHAAPEKADLFEEYKRQHAPRPEAIPPLAKVFETGRPLLIESAPPMQIAESAREERRQQLLLKLGLRSYIVVPLRSRDQVIGTLSFAYSDDSGRSYTPDDLPLFEDLARRVALAVDNARLYQEVREALRVRDAFLSVAAHELRNPLTSLFGQGQVLQRRLAREKASERNQQAIGVIVDQAGRLSQMMEALLDFSRLESGQLAIERRPISIQLLLRQVVDEIEPTLDQHTLMCSHCDETLIVEGDEVRLMQVLHNLIQNAVKYSPGGGRVTIRAEGRAGWAHISVSDQGIGMAPDVLPKLFQRFYRAETDATQHISGAGIGLYVVREIVTRHGGDVTVESTVGRGSTFTVRLPLRKRGA